MFQATLSEVTLFRDSLAPISELIDEAELNIKEKGIELTAADRSVVVIVDFVMSRNAFRNYDHEGDQRLGLNMMGLMQVLRRAMPDDVLKITMDGKKLLLMLEGSNHVRSFTLPIIDVSRTEPPPLDKFDFNSSMLINSDILASGIDDAELVTDSAILTIRKDGFSLKAESDLHSSNLDIQPGEKLKIINADYPVRSRYSLDYLKKMVKARKLADFVNMSMSTDYPLRMQFEVPGKAQLSFILAPRVD